MKHALIILFISLLVYSLSSPNHITGQASELLIIENDTLAIHNLPLKPLLINDPILDSLVDSYYHDWGCTSMGNARGYLGVWEVKNDSLFFNSFLSCNKTNHKEFPQNRIPSFAVWYSDTLRIQEGELIYYEPNGWNRIYEKEHFWVIQNGHVTSKETFENGFIEGDQRLNHRELFKILITSINDGLAENYNGELVFFNFNFKNKFRPFSKSQDSELMTYIQEKIDDLPANKDFRNHEHFPFLAMNWRIRLGKAYENEIFESLHKNHLYHPDNPFLKPN